MKNLLRVLLISLKLIYLPFILNGQTNTCQGTYTFGSGSCNKIIIGNGTPGQINVCLDVNNIGTGNCNPGGSCNPPFNGGGWATRISIFNANATGTDYTGTALATWTSTTGQVCYTVSSNNGYAVLFALCTIETTQISWSTVNSCGLNICIGSVTCPTTGNNDYITNASTIDLCNTAFNTTNAGATNNYSSTQTGCGAAFNNLDCNDSTGTSGNDVSWSIENDIWYTFCPLATGTWNISVTGSNCSNSGGYQLGVFQGTPTNLSTSHYVSPCTQTQGISCVRSLTGTTNVSFTITDITRCVYIVIDGHAGAVCNFSVSVTATNCTLQNALPIRLISFNAKNNKDFNVISWTTQSTSDLYLEKSVDGVNFETISIITQNVKSGYYVDRILKSDISYYRIYDGEKEYSQIINAISKYNTTHIIEYRDILGKTIKNIETYSGMYIELYDDGTTQKKIK